jgi:hypothetical protein
LIPSKRVHVIIDRRQALHAYGGRSAWILPITPGEYSVRGLIIQCSPGLMP